MGSAAGAALVGWGNGQCLYTANFRKEVEPYLPGWLVYVNKNGFRFIDETPAYVFTDNVLNAQPDGVCFAVMDHATFTRDERDPRYKSKGFLEFPLSNWSPERLAHHLANGKILKSETLDGLAELAGMPGETLAATIAEYNRSCAMGSGHPLPQGPPLPRPGGQAAVLRHPAASSGGGHHSYGAAYQCRRRGDWGQRTAGPGFVLRW